MNVLKRSVCLTARFLQQYPLILLVVLTGTAATLMITVFDGFFGCVEGTCGTIVGQNFKDTLQHLSVSASSFKTVPFNAAIYAGEPLQGYHYLPNLLIYLLSIIGIPVTISFFQLLPLAFAISFPFVAIPVARRMNASPVFVGFFLFFAYFGSTFSWIMSWYHTGDPFLQDAVMIPLMDGTRAMRSIHYAFSLIIILAIILIFMRGKVTFKHRMLIASLLFLCTGTKFYGAVVAALIVGIYEVIELVHTKNWRAFLLHNVTYLIAGGAGILVFYNPFQATSTGSKFSFAPFSIVHHMIEDPKLFYEKDKLLARYTLQESGGLSPRLLYLELYSSFLYVVYYFGLRIIGVIPMVKRIVTRTMPRTEIVITVTILLATSISLLFVQKGDWFNIIQFLPYATFLMSFFAAMTVYSLWKTRHIALYATAIGILLLVFVPNLQRFSYLDLYRYTIPREEIEALNELKKQPFGAVFVTPLDPRGAYHSAFSGKPVYYYTRYENVYRNWGIDYAERQDIAGNPGTIVPQQLQEKHNVRYYYVHKEDETGQRLAENLQRQPEGIESFFENDTVILYRILE